MTVFESFPADRYDYVGHIGREQVRVEALAQYQFGRVRIMFARPDGGRAYQIEAENVGGDLRAFVRALVLAATIGGYQFHAPIPTEDIGTIVTEELAAAFARIDERCVDVVQVTRD